jgi:aldose sugar dehydrogenase
MKTYFPITLFLLSFSLHITAQTNLTTRTVATGLDTPWEIIWGPDNHIWVTERFGRISRINPTTGQIIPLITIADVRESGEGGLLGMALDTIVRNNLSDVYVAYNYQNASNIYREKIVKYQYIGTALINPTIIFDNIDASTTHNGCRLLISPDRKLFFTTGDAANTSNSQTLSTLNGKILRLNLDGSIPADNPISNNPAWSWGHRNAQGLVYVPLYNSMYSSEHGANIEDELNTIQKGRNYGWPRIEGSCDLDAEKPFCRDFNVVEPLATWTPTLGVAGIDFYNHNRIPEWKNSILLTSLKGSRLTVNKLSNDGKQVVSKTDFYTNTYGRLRDVCISPDGKVYMAVSNKDTRGAPRSDDDKIVEISAPSTAVAEVESSIAVFPNPVRDILTIDTKQPLGTIELLDNIGRLVLKSKGINSINIVPLPDGIYLLNVYALDNALLYNSKVVKVK